MWSKLALKFQPYLAHFAAIQLILMSMLVLVGCLLLLRRFLWSRNNEDYLDKAKLAAEISEEIQRLEAIRFRLVGGAPPPPRAPMPETLAPNEPTLPPTGTASLNPEAEAQYKALVGDLKKKIQSLEADLSESAAKLASGPAPSAPASPSEDANVAKARIKDLEELLAEYRLFEDDFALVKKFKTENEILKKQSGGSNEVTEGDISKLFDNLGPLAKDAKSISGAGAAASATSKVIAGDAAAGGTDFFANVLDEASSDRGKKVISADPMMPDITKTISANEAAIAEAFASLSSDSAAPEASVDPVVQPEAPAAAPAVKAQSASPSPLSNENLEELAESAASDDKLLEEFEKVLGDKVS